LGRPVALGDGQTLIGKRPEISLVSFQNVGRIGQDLFGLMAPVLGGEVLDGQTVGNFLTDTSRAIKKLMYLTGT